MLVFLATKLWILGLLFWILPAYILYKLFTDRPDSDVDNTGSSGTPEPPRQTDTPPSDKVT